MKKPQRLHTQEVNFYFFGETDWQKLVSFVIQSDGENVQQR